MNWSDSNQIYFHETKKWAYLKFLFSLNEKKITFMRHIFSLVFTREEIPQITFSCVSFNKLIFISLYFFWNLLHYFRYIWIQISIVLILYWQCNGIYPSSVKTSLGSIFFDPPTTSFFAKMQGRLKCVIKRPK